VGVAVGPAAVQGVEGGTAEELVNRGGDPGGFGVLVGGLVEGDGGVLGGGWRLGGAGLVVGWGLGGRSLAGRDQGGGGDGLQGGGDDGGGRAVVAGELHGGGAGEVGGEPGEDTDVGATETVDRLIRVADRGQAGAVAGQ
jgi:hypothetical protein